MKKVLCFTLATAALLLAASCHKQSGNLNIDGEEVSVENAILEEMADGRTAITINDADIYLTKGISDLNPNIDPKTIGYRIILAENQFNKELDIAEAVETDLLDLVYFDATDGMHKSVLLSDGLIQLPITLTEAIKSENSSTRSKIFIEKKGGKVAAKIHASYKGRNFELDYVGYPSKRPKKENHFIVTIGGVKTEVPIKTARVLAPYGQFDINIPQLDASEFCATIFLWDDEDQANWKKLNGKLMDYAFLKAWVEVEDEEAIGMFCRRVKAPDDDWGKEACPSGYNTEDLMSLWTSPDSWDWELNRATPNDYYVDSGYLRITQIKKDIFRFEMEMTQKASVWYNEKKVHVSVYYEGKFNIEETEVW